MLGVAGAQDGGGLGGGGFAGRGSAGGGGRCGGEDVDLDVRGGLEVGGGGEQGTGGGRRDACTTNAEDGEQAVADGNASLQHGADGARCVDVGGVGIGGV